jgi:hypothetical protein
MSGTRKNTLRWIFGGAAVAAIIAAVTIAVWPSSASDRAYDNGQNVGQAVSDVRNAETYDELDNALTDVRHSVRDARDDLGDEIDDQITRQQDAFFSAINGFVGANTTGDAWEQDLYDAEYSDAIDAFDQQAEEFRSNGDDVVKAFWNGVEDGLRS